MKNRRKTRKKRKRSGVEAVVACVGDEDPGSAVS
jgi:hypothetical protein